MFYNGKMLKSIPHTPWRIIQWPRIGKPSNCVTYSGKRILTEMLLFIGFVYNWRICKGEVFYLWIYFTKKLSEMQAKLSSVKRNFFYITLKLFRVDSISIKLLNLIPTSDIDIRILARDFWFNRCVR